VYHVAALGIVLNTEQNQQRFYNFHTDDILCLAVSPDMTLVATGQVSQINTPIFFDQVSSRLVMNM
jgi:microtubule-associated protein-like 6